MEKTLDCRGMACPLPVVNAKNACETLHEGDLLRVLVDNTVAVQNLQRFSSHKGFVSTAEQQAEGQYLVSISIQGDQNSAAAGEQAAPVCCTPDARQENLLVVLSSKTMGSGDDKLGTVLMKSFVFALTKQDRLPRTILCYNSGAFLTCEGSELLEDFKLLESEGVTILTCGTCLDFYGLRDRLAVGGVTNMYEIVERMQAAGTIVRP